MLGAEPRACPECRRVLHHYKGQYWCHHCWRIFPIENTKEADKDLCRFIVQEAEAGKYFSCLNCGKSLFFTNEELEVMEGEEGRLFSQLPKRSEELEEWRKEWALKDYLNTLTTEQLLSIG